MSLLVRLRVYGEPMDDIDAYTPDQVAAVWRTVQTAPSDLMVGELRAWVVEAAEDAGS